MLAGFACLLGSKFFLWQGIFALRRFYCRLNLLCGRAAFVPLLHGDEPCKE